MTDDGVEPTKSCLQTLTAEDFVEPVTVIEEKRTIGFQVTADEGENKKDEPP